MQQKLIAFILLINLSCTDLSKVNSDDGFDQGYPPTIITGANLTNTTVQCVKSILNNNNKEWQSICRLFVNDLQATGFANGVSADWERVLIAGVPQSDNSLTLDGGLTYELNVVLADNNDLVKFEITTNISAQSGESNSISTIQNFLQCPENWIVVDAYKDDDTDVPEFCVMKYEAKNVGMNAVSQPNGLPWTNLARGVNETTPNSAWKRCRDINDNKPLDGANLNYDLISNAQWQSIARQIERATTTSLSSPNNYLNWQNNSIAGENRLNRGNAANHMLFLRLEASSDDSLGCINLGTAVDFGEPVPNSDCDGSWHSNKRTHHFENGEVIWDLSGNAYEFVKDDSSFDYGFLELVHPFWYNISNTSGNQCLSPVCLGPQGYPKQIFGPWGDYSYKSSTNPATWHGALGAGYVYQTGGAIMRGGTVSDSGGFQYGIFTADLIIGPGDFHAQYGFRCVGIP